jgi:hypothetical protein
MASPQGMVPIGRGPSTASLRRDVGIADAREGGVVHGGPPLGWLLIINVTIIPVPNEPPADPEIRKVVAKLQNGCTVGVTGMKAEHLKEWLCGIRREEAEESAEEAGDCWRLFGNLGERHHANSDELGGNRAPPKRGGGVTMVLACLTLCGRSLRRLRWLNGLP